MDSGMISKIEKAMLYAKEPGRISFNTFSLTFDGDNHEHTVNYDLGQWHCDCSYFHTNGICSHTMTMERILPGSVKPAETTHSPYMDSAIVHKVEKAMLYAKERDRLNFNHFQATFQGDHKLHEIAYKGGAWQCNCDYSHTHGVCSHTMTLERILDSSVKPAEMITAGAMEPVYAN